MTVPGGDPNDPRSHDPAGGFEYPPDYTPPPAYGSTPGFPPSAPSGPPGYPPPGFSPPSGPPGYPPSGPPVYPPVGSSGYPPPIPGAPDAFSAGYPGGYQGSYPAGYPGAYPPPYQGPGTNGLAIASLVTSLLAVPFTLFCMIGVVLPIVAIVLGVIALSQINTSGQNGKGLAIAGICVGAGTIVLAILGAIGIAALYSNSL